MIYTTTGEDLSVDSGPRKDTLVLKVGETELTFEASGKISWNGRKIEEDIDLVNAMRELAGYQAVARVMEE